jgi:hypothetical protein
VQVELVQNLIRLDTEPSVASVSCRDDSLVLTLSDRSIADKMTVGMLVAGGVAWGCLDSATLHPVGITRRVTSFTMVYYTRRAALVLCLG